MIWCFVCKFCILSALWKAAGSLRAHSCRVAHADPQAGPHKVLDDLHAHDTRGARQEDPAAASGVVLVFCGEHAADRGAPRAETKQPGRGTSSRVILVANYFILLVEEQRSA